MQFSTRLGRRDFAVWLAGSLGTSLAAPASLNWLAAQEQMPNRPEFPSGMAVGDVTAREAIVWSRADRDSELCVEWDTDPAFGKPRRIRGPAALADRDHTVKLELDHLPPGSTIHYRLRFRDLRSSAGNRAAALSEPLRGSFCTAPLDRRDIVFAWSGDVCGQGFGINPDLGGMRIFDAIRRARPDFFVHSGDAIYADNPLTAEKEVDGGLWRNLVTPAKAQVAQTLDDFRGNYAYNLLDLNLRALLAEVPIYALWDDHETLNNWYPGELLDDERYHERHVDLLAAYAKRAFFEYQPIRERATTPARIDRVQHYGPSLDLFCLDARSDRGPNTKHEEQEPGPDTAFFGRRQVRWLKQALLQSKATWKVIASDMPLSLVLGDTGGTFEGVANRPGPPRGRELEIADLLRFIHAERIPNLVWITADVHYAAAHYYDPARAKFTDFTPFWEFVAGPLNAGTFGPNALDDTFGPVAKFVSVPAGMKPGRSPLDGKQYYGLVRIDGKTEVLRTSLHDLEGKELYAVELQPEG